MKPRAIDLFCGLGGWTDGLFAEGYEVTGYDIEEHVYGEHRYQGELIIQDVRTIHGATLKDAALIVASPPCQEYSYMAMPWKRAKAKAAAIRADTTGEKLAALNDLFNQCFRIQREASFAAGRHIPLIVENVRGTVPWVGRSRWNYGSFYLWGDVPALMPRAVRIAKVPGLDWNGSDQPGYVARAFNTTAEARLREEAGMKVGDAGWRERGPGRQLQDRAIKNNGGSWFNVANNTTSGKGQNPDGRKVPSEHGRRTDPGKGARFTSRDCGVERDGLKCGGDWFGPDEDRSAMRNHSSKSIGRKFASAMIAKIPLPLSRHIGATFRP
jgi:hypothetical protein